MVDIEVLKHEIVERLKPLKPDKIILFGSYAYGTPNEDSDIDLFLLKDDLEVDNLRSYTLESQKHLFDLQKKYLVGVDLFADSTSRVAKRLKSIKDQFYSDIFNRGIVIYAK